MYHSVKVDGVDYRLWLSPCQSGSYHLHLRDQVISPVAFAQYGENSGVQTIAGETERVRFVIEPDSRPHPWHDACFALQRPVANARLREPRGTFAHDPRTDAGSSRYDRGFA